MLPPADARVTVQPEGTRSQTLTEVGAGQGPAGLGSESAMLTERSWEGSYRAAWLPSTDAFGLHSVRVAVTGGVSQPEMRSIRMSSILQCWFTWVPKSMELPKATPTSASAASVSGVCARPSRSTTVIIGHESGSSPSSHAFAVRYTGPPSSFPVTVTSTWYQSSGVTGKACTANPTPAAPGHSGCGTTSWQAVSSPRARKPSGKAASMPGAARPTL